MFIKSGLVLYCVFSCVVYSRLKIRENKTHGKISHSTVCGLLLRSMMA